MGPKMISSSRRSRPRGRRAAGFTLVEMLVVIGILVALVTILLPAIGKAYRTSIRTRMAADLAAISTGLEAYKADFGDYPRYDGAVLIAPAHRGAEILCWALIAPGPQSQDGYGDPTGANPSLSGPGFRLRGTTGTVHQAYLNLDRFKYGVVNGTGDVVAPTPAGAYDDRQCVIADRNNKPILYFVANKSSTATTLNDYVSQFAYGMPGGPRYNASDNDLADFGGLPNLQSRMPGVSGGMYDPSQAVNDNYLLWSAGPDGKYGTDDDATNFR